MKIYAAEREDGESDRGVGDNVELIEIEIHTNNRDFKRKDNGKFIDAEIKSYLDYKRGGNEHIYARNYHQNGRLKIYISEEGLSDRSTVKMLLSLKSLGHNIYFLD